MPSPFPGMDPYIESSGMWGDFHATLLSAIRADLNSRLPKGFAASIELLVWAESDDSSGREPDVFVRKDGDSDARGIRTAVLEAPSTITLPRVKRKRHKFLKVMTTGSREIVTVIEVLSPSNKAPGRDRTQYLEKRNEYFANGLSFVEIDLLRSGRRPPLGNDSPSITDFFAMVCRSWEFPNAGFWTFGLRDSLPDIPVPVTEELGDTPIHLQACVERTYSEGRYESGLSYGEPLKPKPNPGDQRWVSSLLSKLKFDQ